MNKNMKRIISLVLCFVMLTGALPVGALAAEAETTMPSEILETQAPEVTEAAAETTEAAGTEPSVPETTEASETETEATAETVTEEVTEAVEEEETEISIGWVNTRAADADSDTDYLFVATDRHANTSIIGNIINNMETYIGENELDYLALGGDMVGSGESHPAYNSSTVLGEVTGATSSLSATNVDIVAGIHDMNVTDDSGIVLKYQSGGAQIFEGNRFYVYGVEEYCISEDSDSANWSAQASAFQSWANGEDINKSKVIIVVSHYPLHAKRDDNDGAYYWHQALNTVATGSASGDSTVERNIVFFHGHNHTVDKTEYVYNVGETMSIQNGSSTASETIQYTYATAGYLNQNSKATLVTIDDTTITLTKYGTSGSGTAMASVERVAEATPTLSSIAISGTTSYYVGDALDLTVTATYSDGSTKDVTADATLSGYDMNTAGTYTVTATYGEKTATTSITVAALYVTRIEITTEPTKLTYDEGDELDTTGMVVTAVYNNGTTAVVTPTSLTGYDMAVVGTQEVTVNLYDNGTTFSDTFTITVNQRIADDAILSKIEITQDPARTEYLVNDALNISDMVVVATFSDGTTKTLEYDEFNGEDVDGYVLDGFQMHVEKEQTVTVSYTYKELTCTDTFTINVWNEQFTANGVTVQVAAEDYGVTAVNVKDSENSNVSTAVANVISGTNYKAYDITLTLYADVNEDGEAVYALTTGNKTVTLPIPSGVTNPVVYYVSDDGATVTNMNATVSGSNVVFNTTHFSTYVVGESIEITVPENQTQSGTTITGGKEEKTVYVLTSSLTNGGEYLIVNVNTAGDGYAMGHSSGTVAADAVTVKNDGTNTYIESSDVESTSVWTATTKSSGYELKNGNYYLEAYGSTSALYIHTTREYSDRYWVYSSNKLYYAGGNSNHWIQYSSNTFSSTKENATIYIYQKQTIEVDTTVTVTGTYSITGKDISMVVEKGSTATLSSTLTFAVENQDDIVTENPTGVTYEIVTVDANGNTVDGDPKDILVTDDDGNLVVTDGKVTFTGNYGTALVKVSYTTEHGEVTDYITVEAKAPYYSIELHHAELTQVTITGFAEGVNYYTFNETTGFYELATSYVEGTTYYTTPVIKGEEITETIALKGVEAGDTYAVWAVVQKYTSEYPDGKDMGTLGDALTWTVSDTSIASINENTGVITFTGTNYGTFEVTVAYKGADDKVITDTITISVTESLYVVPGDGTTDFPEYPNQGAVRFDKTATAVGNYSETGIALVELSMTGVPYSTGNAIDALLVLDMSTSMKTEVATDVTRYDVTAAATKAFIKTIVQNDDGTYNNNTVAVHYFNGTTAYTDKITDGFITISSDTELDAVYAKIDALVADPPSTSGTDYTTSMKAAYDAIIARDAVSDNTQALVFMSDGGPTYYTYVNGTSSGTVSDDAATIVGWFDTNNNGTTNDETDDTATPNSSFKNEYYSTLLKDAGYPVYTVGLGLSSNDTGPQAFTGLTSGAHEAITSYILSQMATNSSYFYNVADSDAVANMGNIFSGIAASIKEAATDVVVEDMIGENYTVNFSLPTGITSQETDGIEDFYIQVVDYILDSTTHERTGTYSVLENFTFDGESGELISHTVDGTACGSTCSHVTYQETDGVITKINGTYFTYTNITDETSEDYGEYLTWTSEKVTSTELALQYFAYLDNSAGTDVQNQIPAGTYYTNEYATLTYTNYNGNEVQNEFPVPQMTWNGAQVSYTFYLVNEDGQPVNRAGKVIPFAEAVYVTDVFTYAVVWNDMEQAAGLEAKYLAEELVPDVYALYDEGATYNIHVYENESEVNLNNHFVIGSAYEGAWDETDKLYYTESPWDEDATADDLAYTTYVFNNKSDATKYYVKGTYVSDDNDTTANETDMSYFCKSAIIEGATWTSKVENDVTVYTVTSVGSGYQKVDGETQTTVSDIEAAGGSTTGGTIIDGYIYYVDENGDVYTIVQKSDGTEVEKGFDFSNTTVAFAVVWKPQLAEDTVVVDYGLDVVIDVITNDGMAGGVVGVRTDKPDATINSGTYTAAKAASANVSIGDMKIGTATVENLNSVRFSLDKTNGMQFSEPAVFYYEADVNYYNNSVLQTTSMYSSVTVIPATTVYYEDDYVTLSVYTKQDDTWTEDKNKAWTRVANSSKTQDVDRPGESKISEAYDADNVYGYDSAYSECSTYSMDGYAMITVDESTYGLAEFSFYGTGFDVISLTSSDTGSITVKVYDANGNKVGSTYYVDTYYGYTKDENGDWVVDSTAAKNALYQIPVIKVSGLTYGKYSVEIKAAYNSYLDHVADSSDYDMYLDAIRIYDPTGNKNGTANDAYTADGELKPKYYEIRDLILTADEFNVVSGTTAGAVFIDNSVASANTTYKISDYENYGPNNELYLEKGQSVAFELNLNKNEYNYSEVVEDTAANTKTTTTWSVADVQMGVKTISEESAVLQMTKYDVTEKDGESNYTVSSKTAGKIENHGATDLYYSIGEYVEKTGTVALLLTNASENDNSILSLTNIKIVLECAVTTETLSGESAVASMASAASVASEDITEELATFTISRAAADAVLATLNAVEEIPETTEPEITEPEETEPEETEPEETEPEATVPEETEPEVTEPEEILDADLKVSIRSTSIKIGSTITVVATTSSDVDALTVNGKEVTRYVESRLTGNRTWTTTVKATEAGDLDIEVTAFSAEGEALETVTETVAVSGQTAGVVQQIIGSIIGMLFR